MRTLYVRKIADADGKILLEVPVGREGTECGVTILIADEPMTTLPDADLWESLQDIAASRMEPLKRLPQGESDERTSLR